MASALVASLLLHHVQKIALRSEKMILLVVVVVVVVMRPPHRVTHDQVQMY